MRINTKVIFKWDKGAKEYVEVFSKSYNYEGPVAKLFGGTTIEAPEPTSEELELQKMQLDILKQQQAEMELIKPFLLQSLGLISEDGEYRKMTEEELVAQMTSTELTAYENYKLMQERQTKALKGELPLTEAGQQRKAEEWSTFKEEMSRRGNPVYGDTPEEAVALTTSGAQGLAGFKKSWGAIEEAERFGQLSMGESALMGRVSTTAQVGAGKQQAYGQFPYRTSGLFAGYGQAMQPYQQQRQMQFQASAFNAQQQAGLMQGFGELAGIGLWTGLSKGGWMR